MTQMPVLLLVNVCKLVNNILRISIAQNLPKEYEPKKILCYEQGCAISFCYHIWSLRS